jgi:hypothetical protein
MFVLLNELVMFHHESNDGRAYANHISDVATSSANDVEAVAVATDMVLC